MAWRQSGGKPLSQPMMVSLLTRICVTRPQWVNIFYYNTNFYLLRHYAMQLRHEAMKSQRTLHNLTAQVSYGVSIVIVFREKLPWNKLVWLYFSALNGDSFAAAQYSKVAIHCPTKGYITLQLCTIITQQLLSNRPINSTLWVWNFHALSPIAYPCNKDFTWRWQQWANSFAIFVK